MASSAVLQAMAIPPHPSSSTSHSSSSCSFPSARKIPLHPMPVADSGLRRPPSSSPLSLSAKPQHCFGVGTSNREKIPEMPKSASIVAFAGMLQHFPRNQHHQGSFALRCNEGQFVSFLGGRGQSMKKSRSVEIRVIPFQRGDARQQPPPDLPSYLFKNRIIFLGMSLVPSVTELIMAELLYLQYDDPSKPVYMYINSTGTTKDGEKLGYDTEAFAIYDTMRYVKPPIFTLCVGNAWGEAALLLSAGSKGNRSALPSSTIMIKQPISQFRGQATDIDIARREVRNVKNELVSLLSKHTGHSKEKIEEDIRRPKYFSPEEAVEYGIIDKVLYSEKGKEEKGVVADLRKAQLL